MSAREEILRGLRRRRFRIPGFLRVVGLLIRLRYLLFHRHRYDRLVIEEVEGLRLVVLPEVFNPGLLLTGGFMARTLLEHIPAGSSVLDLGCGTGVGSLIAAEQAASLLATDINPAAVRNARLNALLCGLEEHMEVREADLFEGLGNRRFDRILFNPPFFLGDPESELDRAWRGRGLFEAFAAALADHLEPEGECLLVFSTIGALDVLLGVLEEADLEVRQLASEDRWNEVLVLLGVRPRREPSR